MSTIQEIESAIPKLKPEELHAVADWWQKYREDLWDKQIEADAKAGKLDGLIAKAKADYRRSSAAMEIKACP